MQRFHIKRNNIKKKRSMIVSFVELRDIRRNNVPTIMLGMQRKGTLLNLVCSEVNFTSVPKHTWWIDSGPTTHISVCMYRLSCRKPNDGERYIFVGDGKKVEVEAIGIFRLLLKYGTYLDLNETFVVSSYRQNLVSISVLENFGYSCFFGNNKFSLF